MAKTVVGLFGTMAEASKVKEALLSEGYSADEVKVLSAEESGIGSGASTSATANDKDYTDIGSGGGTGIGEKVSQFFRSLSGGDDEVHEHYATGVNRGGSLVAVTVPEDETEDVAALLQHHGAKEIEGGYGRGTTATGRTEAVAATGEVAIPVVEESLVVGKREVQRGGVRVYSHVVEQPVTADVTLHEERIAIERRPVDRAATAADFTSGSAAIELTATGEEAVVGKTSRVVEEVRVGKQGTDRTEAIHDTVRKTEVEVERVEGDPISTTSKTDRY
jgi:uncharacterized protein (TIGR02271 family)